MSSATRRWVWVGSVRSEKAGAVGSDNTRQVLRQRVASSASKVSRLCRANPSSVRRRAFFSRARGVGAWVEGEYHQSPHRGLDGRTPLEQWALAGENVRYPGPDLDLDDLFLFEAKRRVMKDRTVSLHGRLYEVDAILVGQSITLRYDPQAPASRPLQVRHDGRSAGEATRLDAYANTAVKRDRSSWHAQPDDPAPEPRPSPLAMQKLKEKN